MRQFDHVIIGFGKGGKTLAGTLAAKGKKVALIEQSDQMFGGTCINVACIPTKFLENSARISAVQGGSFEEKAQRYQKAIEEKRRIIGTLRQKNYDKAAGTGVEVIVGKASFVNEHTVEVTFADGKREQIQGGKLFINTGARPFIPPIEGLKDSRHVYISETMMELERLPRHLVIIGAGYIGLEFASYYENFGAQVTVIQDGKNFIPREDEEIAAAVFESFQGRGIRILKETAVLSVKDEGGHAVVSVKTGDGEEKLTADAVLVATGRRPNTEGLQLEKAGVELTERGGIRVNEHLRTTNPDIWAMGDVAGGLQFTYISLDDFRIVKSDLLGDGERTVKNRGNVPYSVFIDPPFSRVGMTEREAREAGYEVKIAKLPVAAIPKAQLLKRPTGLLKAIVDAKTDKILGAHLFCAESHEMINLIKVAMEAGLPYTVLRDGIFTHPTMSEALNDLFGSLK